MNYGLYLPLSGKLTSNTVLNVGAIVWLEKVKGEKRYNPLPARASQSHFEDLL